MPSEELDEVVYAGGAAEAFYRTDFFVSRLSQVVIQAAAPPQYRWETVSLQSRNAVY